MQRNRRGLRRNRIFRDRINHPLDKFDDVEIFCKFRFRRADILQVVAEIEDELRHVNRLGYLPPSLQVCLALRFYATGSFQDVCGKLLNVSQPTACGTIAAVTCALKRTAANWLHFPDQAEANAQKQKFRAIAGFPHVVGCVEGTHVEIQAPAWNEQEYVNRNRKHSINAMAIRTSAPRFSPGRKILHTAPSEDDRTRMAHCQLTNLLGEACLADLDHSMFKNRRASLPHHCPLNMLKRNETVSSWLERKIEQEQKELICRAGTSDALKSSSAGTSRS
ncbi:hypothetical protein ACOMHN_039394 [Nucella lapillus]